MLTSESARNERERWKRARAPGTSENAGNKIEKVLELAVLSKGSENLPR